MRMGLPEPHDSIGSLGTSISGQAQEGIAFGESVIGIRRGLDCGYRLQVADRPDRRP